AQEQGQINGEDDDIEDDTSVEALPTHHDVLQAASIINRYINSIDDPMACKLEGIMASFEQQIHLERFHSMVPTQITAYFS
ncbi:hypothetical protein BU17DRAFT_22460, partial [Hysterangium stoloniferum]